jgi:hypothetical protein
MGEFDYWSILIVRWSAPHVARETNRLLPEILSRVDFRKVPIK